MSENSLFLGGRYFVGEYYYLTCSIMNFCCQPASPRYIEGRQSWEFKNQKDSFFGQRYEGCWEKIKGEEIWFNG